MRMSILRWQPLALVIILLLTSCAGGGATTPPPSADSEPAVLRIGWKGSPDTLNPAMAFLTDAYTIFNLVYDTMYELNLDNTYRLSLAESVETSPDGLTWTYHIRPGLTWHDGEPLTARDIAFTYRLYHDHPEFPYLSTYAEHLSQVEAPDDQTVVITLEQPIPNMELQLYLLYVLPEHIWSKLEGNGPVEYENADMVGSGPFKLVGYEQNAFVHLAANPDYFGEKARVDEIIFQNFLNADTLVQALQTGQVDLITELPKTAIPTLRNADNIKLVTGPPLSPELADIFFNQIDPANCPTDAGGKCTGHPALRDRTVRQALAHATNKQEMIDVLLLGLGTPGVTLIPDSLTTWFNDDLVDYAFDLDKANQLLEDAGYRDTDGDGVREMPDGSQPLHFRLYWADDTADAPRMADLLSQTWRQIGVQVEPQTYSTDALLAVCCPVFDYDVIIWGWSTDPDPSLLLKVMTSSVIPNGSSETGYANPTYDALYEEQARELNRQRRQELVRQMQEIVFNDVVYIVPFYNQYAQAYRTDRFTGWIIDQGVIALEDQSSLVKVAPVE
jgi:peptide/nickel transport system substrate-binding protein